VVVANRVRHHRLICSAANAFDEQNASIGNDVNVSADELPPWFGPDKLERSWLGCDQQRFR
jgi:hypothetical protein